MSEKLTREDSSWTCSECFLTEKNVKIQATSLCVAVTGSAEVFTGGSMRKRPNILFLMGDEHRADVLGFMGNKVIKTPTLDKLAATGVVFENAYTPSPICVPGRQSMMAGQFPGTCHCECYGEDLTPGYMTFAKKFSQYAYKTVAAGKLHHMGTDQLQGWTQIIGCHENIDDRYIDGRVESEFERYKPDFKAIDLEYPDNFYKWSNKKEILRAGIGRGKPVSNDEYTILGAKEFIDRYFTDPYYDQDTPERPLLLKVSLEQPHYPYLTDEDKFKYYLNRVKPYKNDKIFDHPFLSEKEVIVGVDVGEKDIKRAIAAYYGMIENLDSHFSDCIKQLEDAGQNIDEWIIIYTADHGEMLGEHGIWEKQKFFEGSVKVPLMIRWPKGFKGGKRIQSNVNLCDLFATLCELADIPAPDGLDSRSLVPFLKGYESEWDDEVISQFRGEHLMIKNNHLKYQYYGENMEEVLFDLDRDPEETINYINDNYYLEELRYFRRKKDELNF